MAAQAESWLRSCGKVPPLPAHPNTPPPPLPLPNFSPAPPPHPRPLSPFSLAPPPPLLLPAEHTRYCIRELLEGAHTPLSKGD